MLFTDNLSTYHHLLGIVILLSLTSLFFDKVIPLFRIENKLFLCLLDNAGHAAISVEVWLSSIEYSVKSRKQNGISKELLCAACLGSLVDIDHFIAARSVSLHNATSLPSRPLGHCLLFVVIAVAASVIVSSLCFPRFPRSCRNRKILLIGVSLLSHQLRDGFRRGLWLYPWNGSIQLSYVAYLACLAMLVIIVHFLTASSVIAPTWLNFFHRRLSLDNSYRDAMSQIV